MTAELEDWDPTQPIGFQEAGSILTTMGFLPNQISAEGEEYTKFGDLWKLLRGEA